MRFQILEQLKAETPLAHLFNAYISGLSTLEAFTLPRDSMRGCRIGFNPLNSKQVEPEPLARTAQRLYELTVLSNSLNHLYWCIEGAHQVLTDFFTTHEADLLSYAKDTRKRLLNEYGSAEDEDWEPDPTDPDGWAVADTDEPARLAPYGLHAELARFFANEEQHGEYIGTSGPIDYHGFTLLVENQTDFCPRKMLAGAGLGELPMYAPDDAGQMVEIPVIDLIESEIN